MSSPNGRKKTALVLLVGGGGLYADPNLCFIYTLQAKKKKKSQHVSCAASESGHSDGVMHIILCYCSANKVT